MNIDNETRYPAVCVAALGRYGGTVRDIHLGAIAYCPHTHKRRSTALECAAKLMQNMSLDSRRNER